MVATQPDGSTIGKKFYETVLRPAWQRLADRFEMMMDEGILKRADPWVAAMHWKGLNEWDMFERRLLGAIPGPDPESDREVGRACRRRLSRLYGANGHKAGKREMPKRPLKKQAPAS